MRAEGRSASGIFAFVTMAFVAFAFSAMFLPRSADAACKCRCVDGAPMAVCSSKRQLRNTQLKCTNLACPSADARQQSSSSTKRCTRRRVYNPDTGSTQWRRLCVNPPAKKKAECETVEFLNPETGLYDSKSVCPGDQ
jgi:hypothetical protein